MSNQYSKGYSKGHVEGYLKLDLKSASKELLNKHYDKRGYTKAKITDDEGDTFTVEIPLYKHEQYKGVRFFIECKHCGKRVSNMLYRFMMKDGRKALILGCRHCLDLNYMCQQVTRGDNDYHFYKIRQIGKKLDPDFTIDDGIEFIFCPFRPKHMKQAKYERLRKEFIKHRNEAHKNWCKMLGVPVDEEELEKMAL